MVSLNKADIIKQLSKDKILAPALKAISFPEIRLNKNLYASLIEAIISQQLSVAAARTIHSRFLALFNGKVPVYDELLAISNEQLRAAGISGQKAGYLKNIAQFGLTHSLAYKDIKQMDDESLILYLTQIKGVGRWTVEMILMFNLQRLNVLPLDDLGIQNSIKNLYQIKATGKELKKAIQAQAVKWSPYQSVACMYLWRWKDEINKKS